MRKKKLSSLVSAAAAALALQFSAAAGAAVLYTNGGVEASPGGGSGMNEFNQAADFTLGGTSNLTGITFFNLESATSDYTGSIFWRIVGDIGGSPDDGNVISTGTATPTRTGLGTASGLNVVQNDFAISVLGLAAGTYWLELHNGPLGTTALTDFYWAMSNSSGGNDRDFDLIGGGPWVSNDSEHAFDILGERVTIPPGGVPLPGTIFLTLAGVGALAARRRQGA